MKLLDREPRCVIDDAPFWNLDRNDFLGRSLVGETLASAPDANLASVNVHASISCVSEHRVNATRRPRAGASFPSSWGRHALVIEADGEAGQSDAVEIVAVDPPNDLRLLLIDDSDRIRSARGILFAL